MSIFATATIAPLPKTQAVKQISLMYAVLLVGMAVTQLFTFDTFVQLIQDFHLPIAGASAYLVAPLIVTLEVFAIPFLLRMSLSPAFRFVSMISGWLVAAGWLAITSWVVLTVQEVSTVGFLGTIGELAPGPWAIFLSIALVIIAAWSSWGMWPLKAIKK